MIAKKFRLSKGRISFALEKGIEIRSRFFIIRYLKNNENFFKFCAIISRKFDASAVIRNFLRRRIYEAVRTGILSEKSSAGYDLVLIGKKSLLKAKYADLREDLTACIKTIIKEK